MKPITLIFFIFLSSFSKALTCEDVPVYLEENYFNTASSYNFILVSKSSRVLLAFFNGTLENRYSISLGLMPLGKKQFQGDHKTPEGTYFINLKNPKSAFLRSLSISYPNIYDKAYAQSQGKHPGGDIYIHGFPLNKVERLQAIKKHTTTKDWTEGCIAVTDEEILELYQRITINTPVLICP